MQLHVCDIIIQCINAVQRFQFSEGSRYTKKRTILVHGQRVEE